MVSHKRKTLSSGMPSMSALRDEFRHDQKRHASQLAFVCATVGSAPPKVLRGLSVAAGWRSNAHGFDLCVMSAGARVPRHVEPWHNRWGPFRTGIDRIKDRLGFVSARSERWLDDSGQAWLTGRQLELCSLASLAVQPADSPASLSATSPYMTASRRECHADVRAFWRGVWCAALFRFVALGTGALTGASSLLVCRATNRVTSAEDTHVYAAHLLAVDGAEGDPSSIFDESMQPWLARLDDFRCGAFMVRELSSWAVEIAQCNNVHDARMASRIARLLAHFAPAV